MIGFLDYIVGRREHCYISVDMLYTENAYMIFRTNVGIDYGLSYPVFKRWNLIYGIVLGKLDIIEYIVCCEFFSG